MYLNDHKIALAAMAESVKDADAIKELMSSAGIPVNNVTLVLIDSMRRAAYAAGREAMRESAIVAAESRFASSPSHESDEWRFAAGEIIDAIRALPGKEAEFAMHAIRRDGLAQNKK